MMTGRRRIRAVAVAFAAAMCAAIVLCPLLHAQDQSEDDFKPTPGPGQKTFSSICAGCHGLDGRGGERAPAIVGNAKVQHLTDTQVGEIISNGVPGTGMPAFHSLTATQIRSVVNYLRLMQGKLDARVVPGDPKHGREIFVGKGECSSCHTISGEGGFFGPDLSAYGSTVPAKAVREAIVNPARIMQAGYKPAAVTTRDGNRLEGLVRNEDNFSMQLLTKDGSFHFFEKADLQNLEYLPHSFMPANYGESLTKNELDDLVSFIMTAKPSVARIAEK